MEPPPDCLGLTADRGTIYWPHLFCIFLFSVHRTVVEESPIRDRNGHRSAFPRTFAACCITVAYHPSSTRTPIFRIRHGGRPLYRRISTQWSSKSTQLLDLGEMVHYYSRCNCHTWRHIWFIRIHWWNTANYRTVRRQSRGCYAWRITVRPGFRYRSSTLGTSFRTIRSSDCVHSHLWSSYYPVCRRSWKSEYPNSHRFAGIRWCFRIQSLGKCRRCHFGSIHSRAAWTSDRFLRCCSISWANSRSNRWWLSGGD